MSTTLNNPAIEGEQFSLLSISTDEFMKPIEALHRSDDSYIGVIRKGAEGIENLFSVTPRELRQMLPELSKWLLEDAYFTVNGYYRPSWKTNEKTGLPCVMRKEDNLRYLNACYADLDIYKADANGNGKNANEAAQLLLDLIFGGSLPQCSMTARSGRGMYVFWILRDDDDPTIAPRGDKRFYRERLELYKQVNKAICARLKSLAADRSAVDGARVLRTPDTRHGLTGAKCVYSVNYDEHSDLFTYTLSELAALFGVREMEISLPSSVRDYDEIDEALRSFDEPQEPHQVSRVAMPKKANGPKSLARDRAQDLTVLEQSREGWHRGERRKHLRLYTQFLRAADCEKSETLRAVQVMASNCQPPYPSDRGDTTVAKIVAEVWSEPIKTHNTKNLVERLQLTHDEARDLGLKRLIPQSLRDERDAAKPTKSPREAKAEQRRQAIRDLVITNGMKSTRALVKALAIQGIKSNPQTVNTDLNELGFGDHPSRKTAGRKSSAQLEFSSIE